MDLSTKLIHDDNKHNRVPDVAPPINVTTTFRYGKDDLIPWAERDNFDFMDETPVYSREGHPNCTRLETIFSDILDGHSVCYSSGLAAFFAAMIHYNPKQVFLGQCYHGVHCISDIFSRNFKVKQRPLEDIEQYAEEGDIVHLESPVNPYGTCIDVRRYADVAHKKGAIVIIDSTFAPPPIQYAWDLGADMIMHSATKYFGGHSDLLGGILVTKDKKISSQLKEDRINLGTMIGNLESYLLLRSLRTYEMRIMKQSDNTAQIVKYLHENRDRYPHVLTKIYHSSLQKDDFVKSQLVGGDNPVFSFCLKSTEQCKSLPDKLKLFHHATSLGGVESLIEWRALSDDKIDQTLMRVSVGCESAKDLIVDISTALTQLEQEYSNVKI
ncbi:putative trans-sulfuration enzyme [Nakaseomyces bracarensis]|uniref:Trans-sulfuration enzyme n=1 Tax=Nakaseomyces bracarensis TaxID=273131 RepID=A0ABR4NQF5_9SACH